MKKVFFVFLLIFNLGHAQIEWIDVSPAESFSNVKGFVKGYDQSLYFYTKHAVFKTYDHGNNWSKILEFPRSITQFTVTKSGVFLYSDTRSILWRSTDSGQTWDSVFTYSNQILVYNDTCFFSNGLDKIFYSYDAGLSWNQNQYWFSWEGEARDLTLGPAGELYVFHGGALFWEVDGDLFRSLDFAQTFEDLDFFDVSMLGHLGVRPDGAVLSGNFISFDQGESWQKYFKEEDIKGLYFFDYNNIFYQVLGYSIRKLNEEDTTWTSVFTSEDSAHIDCAFIDNQNYFYIATDHNQILRSAEPVSIAEKSSHPPLSLKLFPNYPNPFNNQTIISLYNPKPQVLSIKIFNSNGRLVKVLLPHKFLQSGRHQFIWKGEDLNNKTVSSGVYLIYVYSGSYTTVQKCTLIK